MEKQDKKYALIIIDMQNDFVLPGAPACVAGAAASIPKIREALNFFRNKTLPVFYMIRAYRADGSDIEITRFKGFTQEKPYGVPGTKGAEIVDELKPLPGEYQVIKNRFSGFMQTELDFMLRRLGIEHIAVCGTQYPNCIRTTIFDGVAYGYHVTLLTDAASAQTPEIAQSNIRDIANIGVECVTVSEFKKK